MSCVAFVEIATMTAKAKILKTGDTIFAYGLYVIDYHWKAGIALLRMAICTPIVIESKQPVS